MAKWLNIETKEDHPDRVAYIELHGIDSKYTLTMAEVNDIVNKINLLRAHQAGTNIVSERLKLTSAHLTPTEVKFSINHPADTTQMCWLYCRGLFISNAVYHISGTGVTILRPLVEYDIEEGDLIDITYYKNL
jgi:hypothetical protein